MAYKTEKRILIGSWIGTIYLLYKFVPKEKIREAQVIFLFKQIITWLFGLLVVEKKLITYPYRLFFKKANKSSFTFEYFVYPALCVLFNLHYPEKKHAFIRFLYYCLYSSFVSVFEILACKYTKLIRYKNWHWYWSFITIFITNFVSRKYYKWFFKVQ